jgi:hypothetical protein
MDRIVIRNISIALASCYPVAVIVCAVLKMNVPVCANVPWPEVVFGPAMTLAAAFVMFLAVYWIVRRSGP